MRTIAVIDFETTGLSPAQGARATEIAAVLLHDGEIVGRYQSLMYTGAWVPPFVERLTGISNRMLANAPPAERVMREVSEYTRGCAMVAHNASFDCAFWRAERRLAGIGVRADEAAAAAAAADAPDDADVAVVADAAGAAGAASACAAAESDPAAFACTLLLSRRLYPEAANHRLGTLVALHGISVEGRAHRALADAEMAAQLWLCIEQEVERRWAPAGGVSLELLARLQACSRRNLDRMMSGAPPRRPARPAMPR